MSALISASSFSGVTGLRMYADIPSSSSLFFLSWGTSIAVRKATFSFPPVFFISCSSSHPDVSGRVVSMITRLGFSMGSISRHSFPVVAEATS